MRWRQAVDGIETADSELRVNVTDDGRVLNVLGSPSLGLDAGHDAAAHARARRSARSRTRSACTASLPRDSGPAGADARDVVRRRPDAELTIFAERLAYRVTYARRRDEIYDAIIDADTGKVLKRTNLVKSATGDALVWEQLPRRGRGRRHRGRTSSRPAT